ncbi:MAG TPA: tRNA 2-selenouridine(34) synthase MnmH [Candidatus Nanoarchaeia archaeon]|nr:tRNA 2-selenouridine(34) synthase MnmH [Candidatus Nanoarchaeia archaeon]
MPEKITVQEALKLKDAVFIDVRAPVEFEEDHLLEAVNLPILSDEERHIVGTIYKQVSQNLAIEKGMGYYQEKIPRMTEFVSQFPGRPLVIYCWRGGLRSKIICDLFESLGYQTYQLKDGYKAYRALVLEELTHFKLEPKLFVLHGLTCTGKTALLQKLSNSLDLEGLAQHRGSLYGAIGLKPRSQKMFDNLLLQKLKELNSQEFIFIEGESRRIGDLMLPDFLWKAMCSATNVLITRDLDIRVREMVREYFLNPAIVEEIKEITKRLWKVISNKRKEEMLVNLENKEYEQAAEILLTDYYDPLYNHSLNKLTYTFEVKNNQLDPALKEILEKVKLHLKN